MRRKEKKEEKKKTPLLSLPREPFLSAYLPLTITTPFPAKETMKNFRDFRVGEKKRKKKQTIFHLHFISTRPK
jgi:hypothetical protein